MWLVFKFYNVHIFIFEGCQIQKSRFTNCALSTTITCECPECKPGFHGHQCEASKYFLSILIVP